MKGRAPIAVEAETVPVTAGLRHQSGNVEAVSFHFVDSSIVLHLSDKKDLVLPSRDENTQVLGPQGKLERVPCVL